MRLWLACFFILACISCNSTATKQGANVNIRLSKDSQAVCIAGLEYAILHDLKTDTLNNQAWHSLFAVYCMPADTDMKDLQPQQPGKYLVTDTSVIFTPDTAFNRHRQYFVRYYGGALVGNKSDVLRSGAKLEGQHYKEVVFKF
jgi:hypothetical protein